MEPVECLIRFGMWWFMLNAVTSCCRLSTVYNLYTVDSSQQTHSRLHITILMVGNNMFWFRSRSKKPYNHQTMVFIPHSREKFPLHMINLQNGNQFNRPQEECLIWLSRSVKGQATQVVAISKQLDGKAAAVQSWFTHQDDMLAMSSCKSEIVPAHRQINWCVASETCAKGTHWSFWCSCSKQVEMLCSHLDSHHMHATNSST